MCMLVVVRVSTVLCNVGNAATNIRLVETEINQLISIDNVLTLE